MAGTRRSFLQSSVVGATLFALPRSLMAEALDSIRTTFDKAKMRSPEDIATDESLWETVTRAFDLEPGYTNLQTISRGVSPRSVIDAVVDTFRRDNDIRSGGNLVPGREDAIRKQLAAYVNCVPEELAITRNTTEGVTTVLCGWKLQPCDEILTTTQEHEAFYGTLARLEELNGIVVRKVRLPVPATSPDELAETMETAITPRTRLIMVCHIYLTGQIFPVRRLADFAKTRGVKVLVDGALSFGQIKTDLAELNCDFYAASCHKCAGGPRGTGLLYVRPEHIAALPPLFGHIDISTMKSGDHSTAMEKYERVGTQSQAMELSLGPMLELHEAVGIERIQARLHYLKQYWAHQVEGEKNFRFTASLDPRLSCAALGFDIVGKKWVDVAKPFRETEKIRISGAWIDGEYGKPETWREIILVNPAIFTTRPQLDHYVTALRKVAHA
jgi:selenocysteine lyase/cysteine desulfurase